MNRDQPLLEGWGWVLPTEAQWEYACRAGTETAIYSGSLSIKCIHNAPALDAIAWYGGNSSVGYTHTGFDTSDWKEKQHPGGTAGVREVGLKQANGWGLHDMIGNVWEWCEDRHGEYASGAATDPPGATDCSNRVLRGGGLGGNALFCRAAYRLRFVPESRLYYLGFRPALSSMQAR
jgi:formylglycine-generating enzyme required for sulfatase activity